MSENKDIEALVKAVTALTAAVGTSIEKTEKTLKEVIGLKAMAINEAGLKYDQFLRPLVYEGLFKIGWSKPKFSEWLKEKYQIATLMDLPRSEWVKFAETVIAILRAQNKPSIWKSKELLNIEEILKNAKLAEGLGK
jgi:hypothetical protein